MNQPLAVRFRFTDRFGYTVTGPVQGNGGLVPSLARLLAAQRTALDGIDHGLYTPVPGHVDVFPDWTPADNGRRVQVDLRTVTIEPA